jgi:glycine hydroxymethyltransferase
VNAIAGMAVAFKLAQTDGFARLQQQVVDNAVHLAAELQRRELRIPYGGTDTHMLLVDCKSIRAADGVSPDGKKGTPLMGDTAARILDLAGIVCNRNTIPGDKSARVPSGIRLGTPWVTQRGFQAPEIERLAEIIARVLTSTRPHAYAGRHGPVYFAKVDFDILERAKWDVVDLACCVDLGPDYEPSGYPHHYFMYKPTTDPGGPWDIIDIEGPGARGFCNVTMTNDVYALGPGQSQQTWVLEPDGRLMSPGVLLRVGEENTHFQLIIPKSAESRVVHWLRALSDGFVDIDPDDLYAKAPGPLVLKRLPHELADESELFPPDPTEFETGAVGWAMHKPFWIGHCGRDAASDGLPALPPFAWEPDADQATRLTRLYETHRRAGAKMVPFAGWEMPVQYASVQEEHLTVREKAGLFDVSHMGLFEFSGDNVHLFLNTIAANDVSLIGPGESQYSFLLAEDGSVIDDVWVYRVGPQRYWMVVNAANNEKDWAWIDAVRRAEVQIDPRRPWARALGTDTVQMRDLRAPAAGPDMRAQLALQGPRSRDILLAMISPDCPGYDRLTGMERNQIAQVEVSGFDLYVSRTGYTGEPIAFEIFVHPDQLVDLWEALLRAGEPLGLRPIGLAARDSLRIEAGLPLYGHELAGPLGLNPADAGFAPYVKLYKPFFIGKRAYVAHERERNSRLVRFRVDDERAPLPGLGDLMVNRKGRVVGAVTSCSIDTDGRLTGLGYVQEPNHERDTRLGVFRLGDRHWESHPLEELKPGDRLQFPLDITVIARFLNKKA